MKFRIEEHNLDGIKHRRCRVYDLPVLDERDYWKSVTDIPCPVTGCAGTLRWAEAGLTRGYRKCDGCGRFFLADGDAAAPTVILDYRRFRL